MARSWFGSAPMPSGKRLATMTKKRSAVATSLLRRIARSRSRATSVRAMASMLVAEFDDARPRVERARLVRRIYDCAARAEVAADQLFGVRHRSRIERRERLVEQPERHRCRHLQARQRRAPAQALRELAHRNIRHGESRQGRAQCLGRLRQAGELAGDSEILGRRELVLHRRRMAEINEMARIILAQSRDRLAVPAHLAAGRRQKSAENAKEAGLAAAVRTRDAQELAARNVQRQRPEQLPAAALALDLSRLQHAAIVAESIRAT